MLDLAERIRRVAPGELEWCFFNSSGSEANESAMHLAVLYWELQGKPGKIEFLSRVTSVSRFDAGRPLALRLALAGAVRAAAPEVRGGAQLATPPRRVPQRSRPPSSRAALDHVAAFVARAGDRLVRRRGRRCPTAT